MFAAHRGFCFFILKEGNFLQFLFPHLSVCMSLSGAVTTTSAAV